jgi:hypothetical protein
VNFFHFAVVTSVEPSKADHPWWRDFANDEDLFDRRSGPRLELLFAMLKKFEQLDEKA